MTLDDAYEPPKAVQNARRLIQEEQVFALFNTLGTANNAAIWDYANEQEVPHLYVATGASLWGADVEAHPWTIGWQPDYVTESQVYADFLEEEEAGREGGRAVPERRLRRGPAERLQEGDRGHRTSRSWPRRATR